MDSYRNGKCKCIKCGLEMINIAKIGFQPEGGVAFSSAGHYGSTEFDPMDGTRVEIVICDPCFVEADKFYYGANS